MPSKSVDVGTVAVTLVTVPKHKKLVPSGIKIYNADTDDRIITGTDVFTPDASVGETTPSEQTKQRLRVSVGAGLTANLPGTELEDCEFLGAAKFACDDITAGSPVVTLIYHLR